MSALDAAVRDERALEPERIVRLEPDRVVVLDQRRLPDAVAELECRNASDVAEAIRTLAVRGAPAMRLRSRKCSVLV